jgi:hypothetical protein
LELSDPSHNLMEQTVTDLQDITQAYLQSILHYDPATGVWTWRYRAECPPKWNKRWAGKKAGGLNADGYLMIRINGRYLYFAHLLAFIYMEGRIPAHQVDHEDRDPSNCRWGNLREATPNQNGYNKKLQPNNTSGHKGIDWHKAAKKWRVRIKMNGREYHLGLFAKLEDAVAYRKTVAEDFHGEFTRHA